MAAHQERVMLKTGLETPVAWVQPEGGEGGTQTGPWTSCSEAGEGKE